MVPTVVWILWVTFTPVACINDQCKADPPQIIVLGAYATVQECQADMVTWQAPGVDLANAFTDMKCLQFPRP